MLKILGHTSSSYAQAMSAKLGKGAEHARLLYREWMREGTHEGKDPHFKTGAALLSALMTLTDFSTLPLIKQGNEKQTEKYLLKTEDGLEVEMVALPMPAGYTLCISSQVGCRMGCAFCETGKMGLLRSLRADEIVSQVYQAKHTLGLNVRNIVFMGMGEPFDNYDEVMQAIDILTDVNGLALGPSRISVSTSGVVPAIYRFIEEADPALNLAVSINSPTDAVRNRLMPVNHKHDMAALKEAMEAYCAHPRRKILAEYVLIQGKTDGIEDADALAAYLKGLKVTVNLIPYNPQSRDRFSPPDARTVDAFAARMRSHGYLTFVRGAKGQQIMAACGQLGNRALRKKLLAV
ncbi:MAG: Dual-specificity RNA methyltransferase RlmN [Chlamydiales bacterium]|nr:Dual-specificity RNA methyltransferase RlmN [Chlamydiales bacterium]